MARAPQESTIAPVKSDDPKSQKKPDEKEKTTKADGKKDDEKEAPELVCHSRKCPQSVRSNPLFQSEEDLQLKNELEMLVERLRVRSNTFI